MTQFEYTAKHWAMATALTFNEQMLLAIRTAILDAVQSGARSATLSAAGGSESYTRYSLAELQEMERDYAARVDAAANYKLGLSLPDFGRAE